MLGLSVGHASLGREGERGGAAVVAGDEPTEAG